MVKHAEAGRAMTKPAGSDEAILTAANQAWQECLALGEQNGYRNAQASLLAPTGCLTGDTLVTTSRGLARLSELGTSTATAGRISTSLSRPTRVHGRRRGSSSMAKNRRD